MKRVLGAVGGAIKGLSPHMSSSVANSSARAAALPKNLAPHLARVRGAMEALAPPGEVLPSEGRVLAAAQAARAWDDEWYKSPAEKFATANALFTVSARFVFVIP